MLPILTNNSRVIKLQDPVAILQRRTRFQSRLFLPRSLNFTRDPLSKFLTVLNLRFFFEALAVSSFKSLHIPRNFLSRVLREKYRASNRRSLESQTKLQHRYFWTVRHKKKLCKSVLRSVKLLSSSWTTLYIVILRYLSLGQLNRSIGFENPINRFFKGFHSSDRDCSRLPGSPDGLIGFGNLEKSLVALRDCFDVRPDWGRLTRGRCQGHGILVGAEIAARGWWRLWCGYVNR